MLFGGPLTYDGQIHFAVARLCDLEVDATPVQAAVGVLGALHGQLARLLVEQEVGATGEHRVVGPALGGLEVAAAYVDAVGGEEHWRLWNNVTM